MPSGKSRVIVLRVGNHQNVNIFSDIILVRAVIKCIRVHWIIMVRAVKELLKSSAVLQTAE